MLHALLSSCALCCSGCVSWDGFVSPFKSALCVCCIVWHKPWYTPSFGTTCSGVSTWSAPSHRELDAAVFAWHEPSVLLPFARVAVLCHCVVRLGLRPTLGSPLLVAPSVHGFDGIRSRLASFLHPDPSASTWPHDKCVASVHTDMSLQWLPVSLSWAVLPLSRHLTVPPLKCQPLTSQRAHVVFLHRLAVSLVQVSR